MSYKIGRCPDCGQFIHVHIKYGKTVIKNTCEHIKSGVTTRKKGLALLKRNY